MLDCDAKGDPVQHLETVGPESGREGSMWECNDISRQNCAHQSLRAGGGIVLLSPCLQPPTTARNVMEHDPELEKNISFTELCIHTYCCIAIPLQVGHTSPSITPEFCFQCRRAPKAFIKAVGCASVLLLK